MNELVDREHNDYEFAPGARKTTQEIAKRAIVLCCVAASGEFKPGEFNDWLMGENVWEELSPLELDQDYPLHEG